LRIVVARARIVGAVARVAARGEWRTNVALGGHRRRLELIPGAARRLAIAAAEAVGGDFVGIDVLPTQDGRYTALEVNGAVELTANYSLAGQNVFEAVAQTLDIGARTARRRAAASG
jgi:glutathione synthase/RimK-type ligase-like ATP-grasp enzyme